MSKKQIAILVMGTLGLLGLPPWVDHAAGQYHTGDSLICYDCHTMHFSESQGKNPTDPYGTGSNIVYPLVPGGPYPYLLNQPQNQICLSCHDGKSSAPDVLRENFNTSPNEGRQAGALNDLTGTGLYQTWKGHTLYSTDTPPGYNPSLVGLADWYTGTTWGLKCIHCHEMHATGGSYRNLGPSALGSAVTNFQPTYVVATTNDATKDVWINLTSYTPGSGAAAFGPYYDSKNISFNRHDATVGSLKTSNKIASFCAICHANFHGGVGNANIGTGSGGPNGFLRHPTSQITIGAAGSQYSGHSSLSRFVATVTGNKAAVKVAASDYAGYTDATPICITCHKAHGNQNPSGLIYMDRTAAVTSIIEEGTMTGDSTAGVFALCGQCHDQGP